MSAKEQVCLVLPESRGSRCQRHSVPFAMSKASVFLRNAGYSRVLHSLPCRVTIRGRSCSFTSASSCLHQKVQQVLFLSVRSIPLLLFAFLLFTSCAVHCRFFVTPRAWISLQLSASEIICLCISVFFSRSLLFSFCSPSNLLAVSAALPGSCVCCTFFLTPVSASCWTIFALRHFSTHVFRSFGLRWLCLHSPVLGVSLRLRS